MSELVMFDDEDRKQRPPFGLGVSYAVNASSTEPLLTRADQRYRYLPRVDIEPVNLKLRGVSVTPAWYGTDQRFGFALSVGTMLGLDMSQRLTRDFYATVVGTLGGGFEGIVQRRLFAESHFGLAAGVSYRAESHSFYVYDNTPFEPPATYWGPNEYFFTHSIGFRATGLVYERDEFLYLRAVVWTGYSLTLRASEVRVGLSLGSF